jgi:hypothetical protein
MLTATTKKTLVTAFICEPGELEIKALLLAYSIRKNLNTGYLPVVLIPLHCRSHINYITILLFEKLNIKIRYFENPFTKNLTKSMSGDAMSNKFYGLSNLGNEQDILFLDSDIVCLNSFSQNLFFDTVAAKPADYSLAAQWEEIYKRTELNYPKEKVTCTLDEKESPPYFNTGVIFINSESKSSLIAFWEEYFLLFSGKEILENNFFNSFHRDQLAFALATEKLGIKVKLLDELHNYPARSRGKIPAETVFAHYHDCYTIASEPLLLDVFQRFIAEYPLSLKVLEDQRTWSLMAKKRFALLRMDKISAKTIKKAQRIIARIQ